MRMILFICCFAVSSLACSEQSTNSTGDYAIDLGQLYGAIQSVKYMKEIQPRRMNNPGRPAPTIYHIFSAFLSIRSQTILR